MAITSTINRPLNVTQMATGRYLDDGTAAAFTLVLGFKPRYLHVWNLASGGLVEFEWVEGMADASAIKRAAAGDMTVPTTLGITPTADGFTVGLDTDLNVSNEQLTWVAFS